MPRAIQAVVITLLLLALVVVFVLGFRYYTNLEESRMLKDWKPVKVTVVQTGIIDGNEIGLLKISMPNGEKKVWAKMPDSVRKGDKVTARVSPEGFVFVPAIRGFDRVLFN